MHAIHFSVPLQFLTRFRYRWYHTIASAIIDGHWILHYTIRYFVGQQITSLASSQKAKIWWIMPDATIASYASAFAIHINAWLESQTYRYWGWYTFSNCIDIFDISQSLLISRGIDTFSVIDRYWITLIYIFDIFSFQHGHTVIILLIVALCESFSLRQQFHFRRVSYLISFTAWYIAMLHHHYRLSYIHIIHRHTHTRLYFSFTPGR